MTYNEKKQALENIKKGYFWGDEVENIGTIFFVSKFSGGVIRDYVYYGSQRYGLNFEVMMLYSSYFIGSKEHAQALQEALGGIAYQEFPSTAKNPREIWAWEGPLRQEQLSRQKPGSQKPSLLLDIEEIKTILF